MDPLSSDSATRCLPASHALLRPTLPVRKSERPRRRHRLPKRQWPLGRQGWTALSHRQKGRHAQPRAGSLVAPRETSSSLSAKRVQSWQRLAQTTPHMIRILFSRWLGSMEAWWHEFSGWGWLRLHCGGAAIKDRSAAFGGNAWGMAKSFVLAPWSRHGQKHVGDLMGG